MIYELIFSLDTRGQVTELWKYWNKVLKRAFLQI